MVAVPLMAWAAVVLLNFTRPVPGVNVPPLLVQSPETLIVVAVPATKVVPEPRVRVLRFKVAIEPPIVTALVLAVVLLFAGCLGLFFMFSTGQLAATRQRLDNAADASAYSAALWRARVMNYHAYSNRAIVAQEVAIAQAVTLVSWARYFDQFTGNFCFYVIIFCLHVLFLLFG